MGGGLPFPVTGRTWDQLPETDRGFFQFKGDYLPLHPNHEVQIRLLNRDDARRIFEWMKSAWPAAWPDGGQFFPHEQTMRIDDAWDGADGADRVRQWLYDCGIPFDREVFLLYERDVVVQVTWKMLVTYWDAFAWSVGLCMVTFDHTLQWACGFHNENVITFGSHLSRPDDSEKTAAVCSV